ncbi:DUF2087 domain-containing protein [Staphylococcus hyicus]|uniref:DUF2087 domain-containing protein n=1 Tax=Staphylococcus hyicus TaxID=1284 RepID=UPI0036D38919
MNKIKEIFIKNNRIQVIPRKEKDKKALMEILASEFEKGKIYNKKEINEILKSYYDNYVLLRRYMIDYSLLSRDKGGKEYQLIAKENNEDA